MLARPPRPQPPPLVIAPRWKLPGLLLLAAALAALVFDPLAAASRMKPAELSLLRAMNEVREAHGLPPLRRDRALERAARAHSRDMLRKGYFAHGQLERRVATFRLKGPKIGENLAWAYGDHDAYAIVDAWLASRHHRSNLLRRGFRRVGIGALVGRFGAHRRASLVTANFAGL